MMCLFGFRYLETFDESSMSGWKMRWFEASGHFMRYYDDACKAVLVGAVDLHDVVDFFLEDTATSAACMFRMDLADGGCVVLRAPTVAEANRWVQSLSALQRTQEREWVGSGTTQPQAAAHANFGAAVSQGTGKRKRSSTPTSNAYNRFNGTEVVNVEDDDDTTVDPLTHSLMESDAGFVPDPPAAAAAASPSLGETVANGLLKMLPFGACVSTCCVGDDVPYAPRKPNHATSWSDQPE